MFTRGPQDLHSTAVFVGGSDVEQGRCVAEAARQACFDPFRVSIAHDSNGCNSTAAAAVLSASKHVDFSKVDALVLAGTGAVGQTVAKLVVGLGGTVYLSSRQKSRSMDCCRKLVELGCSADKLHAIGTDEPEAFASLLDSFGVVFGCGAAGVELLSAKQLEQATKLEVAVDLNAVPPAGIAGIEVTDNAMERGNRTDYGALGVGGLKMKIHKASIRELFQANHHFIDATRMMDIGHSILFG
jgi:hypothetical protein